MMHKRPAYVRILAYVLCLFSVLYSTTTAAEVLRYITDSIEVPLRTGASGKHRIVRVLKSGDIVELVSTENGWSFVRVDNDEGFVPARYLLSRPTAHIALEPQAESSIEQSIAVRKREKTIHSQREKIQRLEKETTQLFLEKNRFEKELVTLKNLSSNTQVLAQEKEDLIRRLVDATHTIQLLEHGNVALTDELNRNWLYITAVVFCVGLVVGVLFMQQVYRRKRTARYQL